MGRFFFISFCKNIKKYIKCQYQLIQEKQNAKIVFSFSNIMSEIKKFINAQMFIPKEVKSM
jgi:hypothetical protein